MEDANTFRSVCALGLSLWLNAPPSALCGQTSKGMSTPGWIDWKGREVAPTTPPKEFISIFVPDPPSLSPGCHPSLLVPEYLRPSSAPHRRRQCSTARTTSNWPLCSCSHWSMCRPDTDNSSDYCRLFSNLF